MMKKADPKPASFTPVVSVGKGSKSVPVTMASQKAAP